MGTDVLDILPQLQSFCIPICCGMFSRNEGKCCSHVTQVDSSSVNIVEYMEDRCTEKFCGKARKRFYTGKFAC
jgi:hypothetical protein